LAGHIRLAHLEVEMITRLAVVMISVLVVFTAFVVGMQTLFGTLGVIASVILELGASLVIADRLFGQRRKA
jgi:hypothetical protein